MKDPNNPCLFCNSKVSGIAHENDLAYASYDTYPVSNLHCLIIPKRHVADYFELSNDEIIACNDLIKIIKKDILDNDQSVKAFNIGSNAGKLAGQSIMHCHIHLIPRRERELILEKERLKSLEEEEERARKEKLDEEDRIKQEELKMKEWERKFDEEQKIKEESLIKNFYEDKKEDDKHIDLNKSDSELNKNEISQEGSDTGDSSK